MLGLCGCVVEDMLWVGNRGEQVRGKQDKETDASGRYKTFGGGTMFDLPRQLQVEECYIAERYLLFSGRGWAALP